MIKLLLWILIAILLYKLYFSGKKEMDSIHVKGKEKEPTFDKGEYIDYEEIKNENKKNHHD
jgi:hypothetical protein